MIVLRNFEDWWQTAAYDPVASVVEPSPAADPAVDAYPQTDGVYTEFPGRHQLAALYRLDGRLLLSICESTFPVGGGGCHVERIVHGRQARLVVRCDDKTELSVEYIVPAVSLEAEADFTAAAAEDFDFGLFVHNVLAQPEWAARYGIRGDA